MHGPKLAAAAAVLLCLSAAGCSSSGAESRPADPPAAPTVETPPLPAGPAPETPEARNERLLRLEWACDQWWAATQKQEFERQASMAGLLRTYVNDHFAEVNSDLRFGSPRHRRTMAAALGFSERVDAVPPLLEALKDQYGEVVQNALVSLSTLARVEAPAEGERRPADLINPEVVAPYLRHPKPEIRSNAALVLSRIVNRQTPRALLLVLVGAVEDMDAATRVHAVAALGAVGDKEVFPYVVKALHDPVQLVRLRAALALGRMKDPEATPYLLAVLHDGAEHLDVKRSAAKALGEILDEKADTLDAKTWEAKAREKGKL
ncbi:MAG TPA: HEAT repeat domain-containing protein [Planctomycetota bacterium]|nr:HEAT repeat domain-containing protein [Planctomycetota bacterium]